MRRHERQVFSIYTSSKRDYVEIRLKLDKERGFFLFFFLSCLIQKLWDASIFVLKNVQIRVSMLKNDDKLRNSLYDEKERNRSSLGLAANPHGTGYKMCYDHNYDATTILRLCIS